MTPKGEPKQLLTRYALTGGAIGLYFGLFFRPLREANFVYALLLALLVAVVMSGLHLWQKRPLRQGSVQASLSTLPATFAITFVKAALALTLLEGRHLAFDWGGKTAVILFTVIMGAATGLWFAYDQNRQTVDA
jgi:drug/metabolite transporter (DMT)-like permease